MTQEHDVIRQARTLTTTLATARTQLEELTRNIAALKLPDAPGDVPDTATYAHMTLRFESEAR